MLYYVGFRITTEVRWRISPRLSRLRCWKQPCQSYAPNRNGSLCGQSTVQPSANELPPNRGHCLECTQKGLTSVKPEVLNRVFRPVLLHSGKMDGAKVKKLAQAAMTITEFPSAGFNAWGKQGQEATGSGLTLNPKLLTLTKSLKP